MLVYVYVYVYIYTHTHTHTQYLELLHPLCYQLKNEAKTENGREEKEEELKTTVFLESL